MHESKKNVWDTRTVVFLGLLVAIHIVLTRLVVIDLGSYRISVGSICTILAGLWFGPVGGGLCGMVADLLGCLLKGYAVNPLITIAAMMWGIVPALLRSFIRGSRGRKTLFLCLGIILASVISTLGFTTAGLAFINGGKFWVSFMALIPGRTIQWALMTPIYCVLTVLLYFSPLTGVILNLSGQSAAKHAANA